MMDTASIRTIVGIVGNVISFFLFLSPIPTFVRICKKKSVEAFKWHPYVMTVLNCMMWVFYGLPYVHPHNMLVVTINSVGLVIQLCYVTIFLIYSQTWSQRRRILFFLLGEVIFMLAIVLITILCFETTNKRSMFVGILCIIFNIGMYTSPLTVMKRVIQTKSVKYMPFMLSLANFANGIIWSLYALLEFDLNLLIPNGLGALSGLIQLILYATYYRTTNWDEKEKPSEVELP